MTRPSVRIVQGAFAGFAFALLEAAGALWLPLPLDPMPTYIEILYSLAGVTVLLGVVTTLMHAVSHTAAIALTMALWSAVWAPQVARSAGHGGVGWVAPVLLGATALQWPVLATIAGIMGGLAGTVARPRGTQRRDRSLAGDRHIHPHILLVTVDAVRADTTMLDEGRWGPDSPFSPIHGWTHYSQAIAPAPWVLPSIHSIQSGRAVRDHGGGLPEGAAFTTRIEGVESFVSRLRGVGYTTTAIVSNPLIDPSQGLASGFDTWWHVDRARYPLALLRWWASIRETDETGTEEADTRIVMAARDILNQPTQVPRFLWIHLRGPAPEKKNDRDERHFAESVDRTRVHVAGLTAAASGWIVAVVGTHGRAFGEDEVWGTGRKLHDAELRVPLAIRRPHVEGGVVDEQVAVADLARTLLAYASVARDFPGKNLLSGTRTEVEVGGVRNDPTEFALRTSTGRYAPRPVGEVGRAVPLKVDAREALTALGYMQ